MGSAGSVQSSGSNTSGNEEDNSWVADAVNQTLVNSIDITSFFNNHCEQFVLQNESEEYSLEHHNIFQSYQSVVDECIKVVLSTYGLDVSELLQSLEQRADVKQNQSLDTLIRRLKTYENFQAFASQMRSHGKSMQLINGNTNHTANRRENQDQNQDNTMNYLTNNLALDGNNGRDGGSNNSSNSNNSNSNNNNNNQRNTTGPIKINAPIMRHQQPKSMDDELFQLLTQQEQLVIEMKQRQRKCVEFAKPMGIAKSLLKNLFEYVRDAVVSHGDTVQQHMGVIRDILHVPVGSIANDTTDQLSDEMYSLALAQKREESIQRRVDEILPNEKIEAGNADAAADAAADDELARVLEASRQMYEGKSNNDVGSKMNSPTTTLMRKTAITSAADEAERRARLDANEKNYNKTIEEVILRSKIEAETEEATRLRKLMLETAMAAELSEKDHVNSALHAQLMALEARLAGLQARSSATSRVKEETEESLRAELQMKENARKEIQEEMKKIINDSEQRANTLLEQKMQEGKESKEAAHATEEALRLENAVFKKALEREARESEETKTALNEHRDVATRLREELEAAVQIQKELGQHSDSKNMELERLKNMLEEERNRIHQLETEMQQKARENENLAQLSSEKMERNRLHQIALYEQQMEELKQLRITDSSRLKEHEEKAKKLQQELELEGRERVRLESKVETGNQEREAALVSLQEQMAIKEQQLELQKQSIVLAQDHESKAYQLEQKLRKEQESYKSLEVRLKELEESKLSSTRESEVRMQELTSAVEEARHAATNRENETSKELEMMRDQLEKERRKHQQKLLETVEQEIQQAKADSESKVSGLELAAKEKEKKLMEELERMKHREQIEKDARLNAEEEREKLYTKLKQQNEASAFERRVIEEEKIRLAQERNEHSQRMTTQLKELEEKNANEVNELQRRSKEVKTFFFCSLGGTIFCTFYSLLLHSPFFFIFFFFFFSLFFIINRIYKNIQDEKDKKWNRSNII